MPSALSDTEIASAAVLTAIACRGRSVWLGLAVVAGVVAVRWLARLPANRRLVVLLAALAVLGSMRSGQAWADLAPSRLGAFDGYVRVVDDPQPYPSSTRVIVEVEGERFELWARGRARQIRVRTWRGGQMVRMAGDRVRHRPDRVGWVAWQHVVGEFRIDWASDVLAGGPLDRASNRVRVAIERGASVLPPDDAALFRGLVVGDDRDQPRAMIERFRASGLSHLTAVSGQNVSFVLAAAGPLLIALRPWWRWAATLALVGWFVSLTRFEPSIVRAGAMAAISATAYATGRDRAPARVLCLAVTVLLFIDPLLVRSIGFWLSVGATGGVTVVGPWLVRQLAVLGRLATPLGITLGAQVGVAVPSVLVFERLPLVSVPANLLAVPVAGFVMLYGLPAGIVAGAVPWLAQPLMFPARIGVRWVDSVSLVAERVNPTGAWQLLGWAGLVVGVGAIAAMNRSRHDCASAHR